MQEFAEKLKAVRNGQTALAEQYEALLREYETHDFMRENADMRRSLDDLAVHIRELKEKNVSLAEENGKLRLALHEQMLDEKLTILRLSHQKMKTYFGEAAYPHRHRLQTAETELRRVVKELQERAARQLQDERQYMQEKIAATAAELNEHIKLRQQRLSSCGSSGWLPKSRNRSV